jgi:hypothetical protein
MGGGFRSLTLTLALHRSLSSLWRFDNTPANNAGVFHLSIEGVGPAGSLSFLSEK